MKTLLPSKPYTARQTDGRTDGCSHGLLTSFGENYRGKWNGNFYKLPYVVITFFCWSYCRSRWDGKFKEICLQIHIDGGNRNVELWNSFWNGKRNSRWVPSSVIVIFYKVILNIFFMNVYSKGGLKSQATFGNGLYRYNLSSASQKNLKVTAKFIFNSLCLP